MFGYILKNKKFNWIHGTILFVLILIVGYLLIPADRYTRTDDITWGVTYSLQHAQDLGLDWQETYTKMFEDLNINSVRIPVYWDIIEPQQGAFNFKDLDWQMDEAKRLGKNVVLAIGYKTPRWPECRKPNWVAYDAEQIERNLLNYLDEVVNRYKNHDALFAWQVENEPLFDFGECIKREDEFLEKEIAYVKNLDPDHNVIVTDSGELSTWRKVSKSGGDILGFTTYRIVWNPVFGYFKWSFLTPEFYRKKTTFIDEQIKDVYAMELQVEPWHENFIANVPVDEQLEVFTLNDIQTNLNFGKNLQFSHVYLWGVEWWYYLAQKQNTPAVLELVQKNIQ